MLYEPYRYDLGGTGLVYEFITGSVFGGQVNPLPQVSRGSCDGSLTGRRQA